MRRFLFLQGPPGPLFTSLAAELRRFGHATLRVNLSGGDHRDWRGPALNFQGSIDDWPAFLSQVLTEHGITDILLFGDCRPHHVHARSIAAWRAVRVYVLEEGYVRPNWMTFEADGVNANSSLRRDPEWVLAQAQAVAHSPASEPQPPITASFARRARDGFWYYAHVTLGAWRFPHYRSHRQVNVFKEMFGWAWRLARQSKWQREATETMSRLAGCDVVLFPLQLASDYQIRLHSPFADMVSAAELVVASFAANAPDAMHLVAKVHPLDVSWTRWQRVFDRLARQYGVKGRVFVVDGGNLEQMVGEVRGVVCVNSTSATLALAKSTPVCVLGDAIYDLPRLTAQCGLDRFWHELPAPDPRVFAALLTVLVDRCLVRGGIASQSAVRTLIASMVARLQRDDAVGLAVDLHEPSVDDVEMI